jgi:cell division inhibitor SepF
MEEATIVADEIKRQIPVILNLEGCNPEDARRIRDFLGGVTYGLDGYMKKIGTWVYACSPHDMPIERLVLDGANRDQPRYEREDEVSPE